ncbi:MAG: universal stress protein [Lapillicoccus sp.]
MVVGVDGSPTSGPALRWAIREAGVRRIPLHLISAWDPSFDIDTLGLAKATVEAHCKAVLDDACADIAAVEPTVHVTRSTYIGPAVRALIESSHHADILVVGSRRLPAASAFLLGATSLEVAAHSACPVVVVRESERLQPNAGRVVVGVDGSAVSSEAVGYAFAHAAAHGLELTVLHAYQPEYVAGVISELAAEESNVRLVQEELAVTSETFVGWREKFPDVAVHARTVPSHPVDALVAASKTAGLVVVGSRGRGALGSALLGSVGQGVLRHAHCPVAVVRPHPGHGTA